MSIKSKSNSIGSGSNSRTDSILQLNDESLNRMSTNCRARLCHLKKWSHFQGYGFNLHAERAKQGQHIGKVDMNSPAESAGLKEGDRIIEVNYVNISNENHQQVVKRIRNGLTMPDGVMVNENEVVLLVVDNEADEYYKKMNIIVKHDSDSVIKLYTQPAMSTNDANNNNLDKNNNINTDKNVEINKNQPYETNKMNTSNNASTSSLASSAKSINTTNLNQQDSLISNSSTSNNNNHNNSKNVNHDEILPVEEKKSDKKTTSTSSTSNLSLNSSDNQSKSSKSNIATPVSQKKEADFSESHHVKLTMPENTNKNNNNTNSKPHLINGTIDPFLQNSIYAETSNQEHTAFIRQADCSSKDSVYNHLIKLRNNDISLQQPTEFSFSKKLAPARPPPPSLSSTLNYRTVTSSNSSTRSSFFFNNNDEEKKNLESYLEMSAAEFKTYLKSKSRNDPRIAPVDMKQKFQMFQDM